MSTTDRKLNTLPGIATDLGMNRRSLSVLFHRLRKRGEAHPQPVDWAGPSKNIPLYDEGEVIAFYVARSI